jgi:hypothetical protein
MGWDGKEGVLTKLLHSFPSCIVLYLVSRAGCPLLCRTLCSAKLHVLSTADSWLIHWDVFWGGGLSDLTFPGLYPLVLGSYQLSS